MTNTPTNQQIDWSCRPFKAEDIVRNQISNIKSTLYRNVKFKNHLIVSIPAPHVKINFSMHFFIFSGQGYAFLLVILLRV